MATDQAQAHGHEEHPTGWKRYVYSTNHKDFLLQLRLAPLSLDLRILP